MSKAFEALVDKASSIAHAHAKNDMGGEEMMGVSFPTIKVALDDGAYLPERAHATDAGADLRAKEDVLVPARGIAFVNTGVHMELPHEMVGSVVPKSGLFRHAGLITHGTIDEGYDGAIGITVANLTDVPYLFHKGDKVAQLVVQRVEYVGFEEDDAIQGGERGSHGFGSTGR